MIEDPRVVLHRLREAGVSTAVSAAIDQTLASLVRADARAGAVPRPTGVPLPGSTAGLAAAVAAPALWAASRRDVVARRTVLRAGALGALALAAAPVLSACDRVIEPSTIAPGGITPTPHLLQIVVDDLNEYVGFMGGYPGTVHTPNIDALAAQSLRFDQFHVTVPICPPSRATLMWGVDAPTHGIFNRWQGLDPYFEWADNHPEHLTRVLGDAGFVQYGGGKLFHTDGDYHRPQWDEYLTTAYASNVGPAGPDWNFFDYGTLPPGESHPDADLADFVIARLQQLAAAPVPRFHVAAGFRLPHLGWVVPQSFLDLYPLEEVVVHDPIDDWDDLGPIALGVLAPSVPLWGFDPKPWFDWVNDIGKRQVYLRYYLASISFVDHQIGRVLDALDQQPFAAETAVTLVSDNGYHHGENRTMRKGTLRDQSTRVPFLVRHPELAPQVFADPVSSLDYATTVLGLVGVSPPPTMEGVDLVREYPTGFVTSYFVGREPDTHSESHISTADAQYRWVFHRVDPSHPRYAEGAVEGIPELELYDRIADPHETVNLLFGF